MGYKPYTEINTSTLEQVSDQYTDNLKLYLAIANWSTITRCLIAEFRGIPEYKYLLQTNHPCQIHYGFSTKPGESIEQLVKNTTAEVIKYLKPETGKIYKAVHLGSGIGGSDFQIAENYENIDITGFSISSAQVHLANKIAQEKGISDRVRFITESYLSIPDSFNETFDFGYAIESFCHTPNNRISDLFNQVNKILKPGALFVVSDGFFNHANSSREKALYFDFLSGWDLPQLADTEEYINTFTSCGFKLVEDSDKTNQIMRMASKLKTRAYLGKVLIWVAKITKLNLLTKIGLTHKNVNRFSRTGVAQFDIFNERILDYKLLVFQKI